MLSALGRTRGCGCGPAPPGSPAPRFRCRLAQLQATTAAKRLQPPASLGAAMASVLMPQATVWQEVIDPTSGLPYYWNTKSNVTQWERPAELGPPTAASIVTFSSTANSDSTAAAALANLPFIVRPESSSDSLSWQEEPEAWAASSISLDGGMLIDEDALLREVEDVVARLDAAPSLLLAATTQPRRAFVSDDPAPASATTAPATTAYTQPTTTITTTAALGASGPPGYTFDDMFESLAQGLLFDRTGVIFGDTAMSLRRYGVFSEEFFVYLDERMNECEPGEDKELLFRMICRLSNPYLRQPAVDELVPQ